MPETKKPTDNLPKTVEPGDVTVPGHFGSRLLKGVTDAINDAVTPNKKPKKPPPQPTTGLKDVVPRR